MDALNEENGKQAVEGMDGVQALWIKQEDRYAVEIISLINLYICC